MPSRFAGLRTRSSAPACPLRKGWTRRPGGNPANSPLMTNQIMNQPGNRAMGAIAPGAGQHLFHAGAGDDDRDSGYKSRPTW